jgi:hypothetical protein
MGSVLYIKDYNMTTEDAGKLMELLPGMFIERRRI